LIIVLIRRHYFSKRFEDVLLFNKARRMREEHRRKQRSTFARQGSHSSNKQHGGKSLSTARPSAPTHLRKLRRSSYSDTPGGGDAIVTTTTALAHPYSDIPAIPEDVMATTSPCSTPRPAHSKVDMWPTNDDIATCYPTSEDDEGDLGLRPANDSYDEKVEKEDDLSNKHHPLAALPSSNTHDNVDVDGTQEDSLGVETTGIAFADNIEKQRAIARHRLEQDRRFREVMDKLAHHQESGNPNDELLLMDDIRQEEEIDRIMREPIDKSQLTREQRNLIGGAEYRALDILVKLVPAYYLGIVILFAFFFRIYIACSTYAQDVLRTTNANGPIDPWFFSFFQSLSGLNNLGIMLCDASMVPFQNAPAPLIFTMILILCGNTAYAINLRFIIWSMYKLTPRSRPMLRETLRYLLDHPRRCYTTLFPSTQTFWLLLTLVVITIIELACFLALNYWLPVLDGLNWASRFIDGLFQSISTRNGEKRQF
jgi:hypothetical protein